MGKARFSDEFKRDAVHQIIERGYQDGKVSRRLDVSTHSLFRWMKKLSKPDNSSLSDEQAADVSHHSMSG